jgi:hypothetical protein
MASYDGSLGGLFGALDEAYLGGTLPLLCPPEQAGAEDQPGLFDPPRSRKYSGVLFSGTEGSHTALLLGELSIQARDAIVLAWMSEFPIETRILRYGLRVLKAGEAAGSRAGRDGSPVRRGSLPAWVFLPEAREAAGEAAAGRLEDNAAAVLEAAAKTRREVHRLEGLLRFKDDPGGALTACCEPDHFVLPLLAEHFERRFGDLRWTVFDRRRKLCLAKLHAGPPRIVDPDQMPLPGGAGTGPDQWEGLWRGYFKAVNNGYRKNPRVQRAFMPRRYWKYLPELD